MPTDVVVKRKGVPIASKCLCCHSNFNMEFNNHLFISLDTVKEVRKFFSVMMNADVNFLTINYLLTIWCRRSKGNCLPS